MAIPDERSGVVGVVLQPLLCGQIEQRGPLRVVGLVPEVERVSAGCGEDGLPREVGLIQERGERCIIWVVRRRGCGLGALVGREDGTDTALRVPHWYRWEIVGGWKLRDNVLYLDDCTDHRVSAGEAGMRFG